MKFDPVASGRDHRYLGAMAATGKWTDKIECPRCAKAGEISTWQYDGAAYLRDNRTYVSDISEGFSYRELPFPEFPAITCMGCGSEVPLK